MTIVKICGLSDIENAMTAIESGADFIGFVFAKSPRQVTAEKGLQIIRGLEGHKNNLETVGVFANSPVELVNGTAEYCHLDRVQLSGDETWAYCKQINRPLIKVLHISEKSTGNELISNIDAGKRFLKDREVIFLIDSRTESKYGGTGKQFDWKIAQEICQHFSVIVAGGLNPENVSSLLSSVHPWGVDVSSGVETNGQKDSFKIKRFITAVRQTDIISG